MSDPKTPVDPTVLLNGRVVVITGGSSGIGLATALKAAMAGANTVIVARDPEKLKTAAQQADSAGLTFHTFSTDLTNPDASAAFVGQVIAQFGGCDVLVNNAGHSIRRSAAHSLERMHDYERLMAINYFAALRLIGGFLPGMLERGGGQVVNVSALAVLADTPRFSGYAASKAALEAWTRCAAAEYFGRGVSFSTVHMPLVKTPMIEPTKAFQIVPKLSDAQAADLIMRAIVERPQTLTTNTGRVGGSGQRSVSRLGAFVQCRTLSSHSGFESGAGVKAAEQQKWIRFG